MKPTNFPLTIYGGVTLDQTALAFTYKVDNTPLDLTNVSIVASCKRPSGESVFTWSTENGAIKTDPLAGAFWPDISAEETRALEQYAQQVLRSDAGMPIYLLGVWVLDMHFPDSRVVRLLQGSVGIMKGA